MPCRGLSFATGDYVSQIHLAGLLQQNLWPDPTSDNGMIRPRFWQAIICYDGGQEKARRAFANRVSMGTSQHWRELRVDRLDQRAHCRRSLFIRYKRGQHGACQHGTQLVRFKAGLVYCGVGSPMKKCCGSLIFLVSLAGSAWATVPGPAPEITSGILGMTMAAGVVYLMNRRKRG